MINLSITTWKCSAIPEFVLNLRQPIIHWFSKLDMLDFKEISGNDEIKRKKLYSFILCLQRATAFMTWLT